METNDALACIVLGVVREMPGVICWELHVLLRSLDDME